MPRVRTLSRSDELAELLAGQRSSNADWRDRG